MTPLVGRALVLVLIVVLALTTLVPLGSLANRPRGSGLGGSGSAPSQAPTPGTAAPESGNDYALLSIDPPSATLLADTSQSLTAQVESVFPADPVVVQSVRWVLLNATGAGSLSPTDALSTTLTAASVLSPVNATAQVTVTGYAVLGVTGPFTLTANASVALEPVLEAGPFSISPDPATAGTPVVLQLPVYGGTGPYQVRYRFGDGSEELSVLPAPGTDVVSHTYALGDYRPQANVSDALGEVISVPASTPVVVGDTLLAAVSGPGVSDVGVPVTFSASVTGGTPPYAYAWQASRGTGSVQGANFTVDPSTPGPLGISLIVHDSSGRSTQAPEVSDSVAPLPTLILAASPPDADVGLPLAETLTIAGGTPPYTISWEPYLGGPSLEGTFPAPGVYPEPFSVPDPGPVVLSGSGRDASGVAFSASEEVGRVLPDPQATLTGSATPLATGSPFTLWGTVSGGLAPYHWDLSFSSPVTAMTAQEGSLSSPGVVTFRGTLDSAGSVVATLSVEDADQANVSASFPLTGVAPLTAGFLSPLPPAEVGLPVSLALLLSGGTPPYQVDVEGSDGVSLPLGPVLGGLLEVPWVPRVPGPLTLSASVQDSGGLEAFTHATVSVAPALGAALELPTTATDVGSLSLTVTVEGGVPPYAGTLNVSDGPAVTFAGTTGRFPETLDLPEPGSQVLSLQVTDALGDRVLSSSPLTVHPLPQVALVLSAARVDVGEALEASLEVQGGTGPWSTETVDFGDGSAPVPAPAGHAYQQAGTYTVTARLVDATGVGANATPVRVSVVPDPSATSSLREPGVDVGLATSFESQVSFGVPPYNYSWQFGDGTGSSLADPTTVFWVPGLYQVSLTVTDAQGTTASAPPLNVSVAPAPTLLLQSNESTPEVGEPVLLSALVLGGSSPENLLWTMPGLSGSGGSSVSYTFPQAGTQTVRVVLTDGAGAQVASSLTLPVAPALSLGPVLVPSPAAEVGVAFPLAAQEVGGVGPFTYRWQLGSLLEVGLGLADLTLTPGQAGSVNGTLEVTDATGTRVYQSLSFPVVPHVSLGLGASATEVDEGSSVSFEATADGGYGNLSYHWEVPPGLPFSSDGPFATASTVTPGRYVIGLTVEDGLGATAQGALVLTVNPALVLSLSSKIPTTDVGLPTPVDASMQGGTPPYSSGWVLPPGASVLPSGALLFSRPGDYTLEAWARDQAGATVELSLNVSVLPAPSDGPWSGPSTVAVGVPEPYTWTPEGGSLPWSGGLEVLGLGSYPGLNATITFPHPGNYTLVGQAVDAAGAVLTSEENVTAMADPLALELDVPVPEGLLPFLPTLTGVVEGGMAPFEGRVLGVSNLSSTWVPIPSDGTWNLTLPIDAPGGDSVTLEVRDALGKQVEQTTWLDGLAEPPAPLLTTPAAQAGVPETLVATWPDPWSSPGEIVSETWWGPGLTGDRGGTATFLENRSGMVAVAFSVSVFAPDRTLLTNLTFYTRVEVRPGPVVGWMLPDLSAEGFAGQNVSVAVAEVDAFGNVNTTASGNATLQAWQGAGALGDPELSPVEGGWARFLLSEERAGNVSYVLSAPGGPSLTFSYTWIADPEEGVLRVASYSVHGPDLFLTVEATDVYGNPLSGYPVTAQAPGLTPVSGVAEAGRVTLLLPGAGSALRVNVTGPYGAATTVLLPGPGSPPPDLLGLVLLALFLGGLLGSALFFRFRRKGRKAPPPLTDGREELLEQVEATPGEEADSLGALAQMKGWPGDDAGRELEALAASGKVHREEDAEGKTRYYPGPAPKSEETAREGAL